MQAGGFVGVLQRERRDMMSAVSLVNATACFVSVLTIIQLQTDLRDLQKNDKNGTTGNQVAG